MGGTMRVFHLLLALDLPISIVNPELNFFAS